MDDKRVELKLSSKNTVHQTAIKKINNFDRNLYHSQTEYIVKAINAYEEPLVSVESEIRKIIREELQGIFSRQNVQSKESEFTTPTDVENTGFMEEPEEEKLNELDSTTLDFLHQLAID